VWVWWAEWAGWQVAGGLVHTTFDPKSWREKQNIFYFPDLTQTNSIRIQMISKWILILQHSTIQK
jgi:hypothetical protein